MSAHSRKRAGTRRLFTATGVATVLIAAGLVSLAIGDGAVAAGSTLVRYPYLTDLTAGSVQVTFDTTTKIASANGAVRWGTPSGASGCTLTGSSASSGNNSVNAPITVAGATEYQTSIQISGLSGASKYCYRVYTGGTGSVDLLGTDSAPRFTTLTTSGSFSFDVLGDWGDNTVANGLNQANIDALIASSGAQFAVSTGDIAYQTGTQTEYGNLVASGTDVSQVFGASYWKSVGASIPLFSTTGNHGRSLTFLQNWKQAATVAASGGRYAMDTYAGTDGTTSASYPSVWYAFDAGGARFYVIEADWNDNNLGTAAGGAYQVDHDYHWQTTSPEYQWLKADLASHANSLKFAFFHYPLRADSATEPSDTFLQNDPNNPTSVATLEGLLANNGVDLAFNGHAHLYQRNVAPPGGLTSYVTGGGGAKISPVDKGNCSSTDAYAVGWSYTSSAGSSCGAAPTPTSDTQVYHFLKVTVSGSTVTVTPTDSTGRTFDPMTYHFAADSTAPAAPTGLLASSVGTGVKLSWTASTSTDVSAQDVYRNGRWLGTVPVGQLSYTDTAPVAGASYTVRAHDLARNQSPDSAPASVGSGTDTAAPSVPSGVAATATAATSIKLTWSASTDNVGVSGYQLFRDGASTSLTSVAGTVLSYVDNTVTAQSTHSYTVQAFDAAGNLSGQSAPASAITPAAGGGGTVSYPATDDVTLDSTAPTTPAAATGSRLSADGSPVNDVIIRFDVQNLPAQCQISNATLRLTVGTSVNNNSVKGGDFYASTNSAWSQSSVTWNTSPQSVGGSVATLGAVSLGETVNVDVTSLVHGTGQLTIRIKNTSADAAQYYSKEGSTTLGPQLLVTC